MGIYVAAIYVNNFEGGLSFISHEDIAILRKELCDTGFNDTGNGYEYEKVNFKGQHVKALIQKVSRIVS